MQDILIQAQFLETPPAAVESAPRQEEINQETSFDDVLETRLDERERKKLLKNETPEAEQMAAAAQNQQTAQPKQEQKAAEAKPESDVQPVRVETDVPAAVAAEMPEVRIEPDTGETAEAPVPTGELADQPAIESMQETLPAFEEMLAETRSAGTGRSSEEDIINTESEPIQATIEKEGKPLSEQTENEKPVFEMTGEKNTSVQTNKPAEQPSVVKPEAEQIAVEEKTFAASEQAQEETADFEMQPDLETSGKTEVQAESSQNDVNVQFQQGTAPPQVSNLSEPARSAEAQPAVILPQIEDGVTQLLKSKKTSMQIQLHPEELGRIQIKLVQDDNGLRVAMSAEQQDTNQLLERHLHTLQKSLSDAGIELTGFDIGSRNQHNPSQTPDSWQSAAPRQPEFQPSQTEPELIQPTTQQRSDTAVDYRI